MSRHATSPAYRALVSSALRSEGVQFEDAALFLLIASYGNADGKNCFPSMETLALSSGHDPKWVKRSIARLRRSGWITSRQKITPRGRVNVYTLHWAQIGPDRVRAITRGGRAQIGADGSGPKRAQDITPVYQRLSRTRQNGHAHHDADEQPLETRTEP